jgi:hypothetical protein
MPSCVLSFMLRESAIRASALGVDTGHGHRRTRPVVLELRYFDGVDPQFLIIARTARQPGDDCFGYDT